MDELESLRLIYEKYYKQPTGKSDDEIASYIKENGPSFYSLMYEGIIDESEESGAVIASELRKIVEVLERDDFRQAFHCINVKMDRKDPVEAVVAHFVASRRLFADGDTFYEDLADGVDTLPLYLQYFLAIV